MGNWFVKGYIVCKGFFLVQVCNVTRKIRAYAGSTLLQTFGDEANLSVYDTLDCMQKGLCTATMCVLWITTGVIFLHYL